MLDEDQFHEAPALATGTLPTGAPGARVGGRAFSSRTDHPASARYSKRLTEP